MPVQNHQTMYYKFKPRNHLCSLMWTLFLLIAVTRETKLINGVSCGLLFGVPTIVAGINLREKAERFKRRQLIRIITEKQMLTVSQAANVLDLPAVEAQDTGVPGCRKSKPSNSKIKLFLVGQI